MVGSTTFIIVSSLALLAPPTASSPTSVTTEPRDAAGMCLSEEAFEPISLTDFWREAEAREPGYAATSERTASARAVQSAVLREWVPTFSLTGIGNHGQRLSPSEERSLGVGPRGEVRLLGAWTLLDSDRWRRGEVASYRTQEAMAAGEAFDLGHRAELAILYAEAAASEESWEAHQVHVRELLALTAPVRELLAAGLDVQWEDHLLDEATARAERLRTEADLARTIARQTLSSRVGACVRAVPMHPRGEAAEVATVESPVVTHLLLQAETHEALARQERSQGHWRVQLLGSAGPNHSRAFDDGPVRNEYLVGLSVDWRPDLAGVRRQMGASQTHEARAVQAEAESLRLSLERGLEQASIRLAHADARQNGLAEELAQARRRQDAALLRWQAGVDRWTEVMQATDRVLDLQLLDIELRRSIVTALVQQGLAIGTLDALQMQPAQESDR